MIKVQFPVAYTSPGLKGIETQISIQAIAERQFEKFSTEGRTVTVMIYPNIDKETFGWAIKGSDAKAHRFSFASLGDDAVHAIVTFQKGTSPRRYALKTSIRVSGLCAEELKTFLQTELIETPVEPKITPTVVRSSAKGKLRVALRLLRLLHYTEELLAAEDTYPTLTAMERDEVENLRATAIELRAKVLTWLA